MRDDITNLEKSINDMKANIKNTIDTQNRVKENNYQIWSNLEAKPKAVENTKKQLTIQDILGELSK